MLFNESMEKLEQLYEDGGIDQELYEYLNWSMKELKTMRYSKAEHPKIRLEGKWYGMLQVIEEVMPDADDKERRWLCKCECGNTRIVKQSCLKDNRNCSCGCALEQPNYIGKRYGRLVVIGEGETIRDSSGHKRGTFICQCDCGKVIILNRRTFIKEGVQSCGCLKELRKKYKTVKYKKLHDCWVAMKQRCYNPNEHNYNNYGGRGIKVCPEWLTQGGAYVFCDWALNNGYRDDLSIDRINVNGDYTPENCRWIPMAEQQRNRRNNHWIEYNGETKCLAEWAETLNIDYSLLCSRIGNGWSMEEAITIPKGQKRKKA